MRRIAIVTGGRQDYGHLYWIIRGVHEDPALELQLIVTGMHLSHEFGLTVRDVERDGFPIAERVEMLISSDSESAIAVSMGVGMIGFAKTYERLRPDILVVLGDRFELLSAVAAAIPFRIPVAHIHGGEATEAAIDEQIRNAITKISHIHFPCTKSYSDRIIRMGEHPDKVFCFGAPGLDNIYNLDLWDREKLGADLGLPADRPLGSVTYHPVTLQRDAAGGRTDELLGALDEFPDVFWVFTLSNADTEGRVIIEKIKSYVTAKPERAALFSSLGQLRYLSLLKNSALMVGNSSSGIIEAPSFELPVVNISDRQKGRVRAANVIDVPVCGKNDITTAIRKAFSKEFRSSLEGLGNPYGKGDSSRKIVEKLKTVALGEDLLKKSFYEMRHE